MSAMLAESTSRWAWGAAASSGKAPASASADLRGLGSGLFVRTIAPPSSLKLSPPSASSSPIGPNRSPPSTDRRRTRPPPRLSWSPMRSSKPIVPASSSKCAAEGVVSVRSSGPSPSSSSSMSEVKSMNSSLLSSESGRRDGFLSSLPPRPSLRLPPGRDEGLAEDEEWCRWPPLVRWPLALRSDLSACLLPRSDPPALLDESLLRLWPPWTLLPSECLLGLW
mmetsp:Transcript_23578/g.55709  ORF Transcript_23578/g.55709 Transcript_23578/m.55709 type:complete len:223 (+) Transcript_23578:1787-2455(+)